MIYWDASAVVPLLVREASSAEMQDVLESDRQIVVWWGTPVECVAAVARRERNGTITAQIAANARRALQRFREHWTEIQPLDDVRTRAEREVLRHDLRAGDALQLGSALVWSGDAPAGKRFCTLDVRLAEAARREGFDLVR